MEPGQSRLCPRCGTRRIGNFRWCRSCQFDFDAPTTPPEAVQRPFELTTPGRITQNPHIIPADASMAGPAPSSTPPAGTPPAAGGATAAMASAASAARSTAARQRTPVPAFVVVAVVAVFILVAIGILSVLLPESSPIAALPSGLIASAPAATPASQGTAASPTPAGETTITGQGNGKADFAFADSTGLATITNEGTGAFGVWTLGADGSRQAQIVDRQGLYVGTRRFAAADGRVTFDVESDGPWSIEVKPAIEARTWNRADPLIGDGDDVVLLFPQPDGDVRAMVISDGAIGIAAYAGGSKHDVVDENGTFQGEIMLPAGTSLLEISADSGWSIRPG